MCVLELERAKRVPDLQTEIWMSIDKVFSLSYVCVSAVQYWCQINNRVSYILLVQSIGLNHVHLRNVTVLKLAVCDLLHVS